MAQNTGAPYNLPWPDYTDDADGPDAFENLARAVDIALKGLANQAAALSTAVSTRALTVADSLVLGSTAVNKDALFDIKRLATGGAAVTFRHYVNSAGTGVIQLFNGSSATNQLHFGQDGNLAHIVANNSQVKYLPFAMCTFSISGWSIPAGAGRLQTQRFNFPAGRFTQIPAVQLTSNNPDLLLSIKAQSTTWVDVEATAHLDKGASGSVHGLAIQMKSADAFD